MVKDKAEPRTKPRAKPHRVELTARLIDSLDSKGQEFVIYWDTKQRGLGLRVMKSGVKTYILDYRIAGRHRRIGIGKYGVKNVYEVRKKARRMFGQIEDRKDPAEEQERARGALTFRGLAEQYIELRCPEKKSGREDERMIRRELVPRWGHKLANQISRGDVIALADEIKKRGAGVMANRTLSLVRRLYNWGIDAELVQTNPAAHIKARTKEKSRDRVLSADEIKALWERLEQIPGELGTRLALKLILVTAQRPGEVVRLAWEEIDSENVWTIPAEKSKNGRAHRVPLSPLALELLGSLDRRETGPVFPSPLDRSRPITRAALARMLHRGRGILKLAPFTPHDLRRTSASKMAEQGISRLTISKVLNHADRGVTAVYDRHGYDEEKRAALEAWGMKLRDIIEGRKKGKVIRLVS